MTAVRANSMCPLLLTAVRTLDQSGTGEYPVRPAFAAAGPRMSSFRECHDYSFRLLIDSFQSLPARIFRFDLTLAASFIQVGTADGAKSLAGLITEGF